ncbi:MAG: hypothetical protein ACI35S_09040 [Anaeroplasma sp.]
MNYKKVKLSFKYCSPKRFYRTLLVKEDTNLVDLGCAIVTAFKGTFEHFFLFNTKTKTYNPSVFLEDYRFENDVLMDDYKLSDLGNKFEFTYDTGDGWDFNGTVTDSNVEVTKEDIILIDGAGQGIWEDNIHTLYAYLNGKIDPDSIDEDEENGYYPPWNMNIEKYSDFDNAFDLEVEKELFSDLYKQNIYEYKQNLGINSSSDFDDEDEDSKCFFPPEFYDFIMAFVKEGIKNIDFMGEVYNKLLENHKPKEAKELIAKEFIFMNFQNSKKEKEFDIFKFEKVLRKLV